MAIAIRPVGERFMVELTPPHGYWRSPDPLAPTDVIARLAELGCHSTDVTDALGFGEQTWMVAPGTLEEVGESATYWTPVFALP